MIPLSIQIPAVEEQAEQAMSGGDDVSHKTCCREAVSLCGQDVTGWRECEEEPPPAQRCIRCDFIDEAELPCGAPFCRLRSAWARPEGEAVTAYLSFGSCYLDGTVQHANGTVQLTIKGHRPAGPGREVAP